MQLKLKQFSGISTYSRMSLSAKLSSSNFLRQFRDAESRELYTLSAVQFMEVWDHYDTDGGYYW